VAQHVRVRLEGEPSRGAGTLDQLGEAGGGEGRAALAGKDDRRRRALNDPRKVFSEYSTAKCPSRLGFFRLEQHEYNMG
jgi:hypothetical protein